MLKELIFNKKNIKYLNSLVLVFIFVYMAYKLRYAIVVNDDITDILLGNVKFIHGRYFTELFSVFMVKTLPELLKIHVQNFAFVSEGLTKAGLFTFVIFIIGKCFSGQVKNLNKYNFLIYIFSFFLLVSLLKGLNSIFDTMQFFCGYIVPFLFFIPLWLRISDYYIFKKSPTKKDIFILCIFALLTGTGNELVAAVTLVLLSLLLIENIILKIKDKNVKINGYIYYPLIICLIAVYIAYSAAGTQQLLEDWGIKAYFKLETIPIFLKMLINIVFLKNLFLWIPSIICLVFIKYSKIENKNEIIKYAIYTYIGIVIFYLSLYFFGETYDYTLDENYYIYPRFWILYKILLLDLRIVLYCILLYLTGIFITQEIGKREKNIFLIIMLIPPLLFIFNNYSNVKISDINKKQTLYLTDKVAVFYFKQGKTAILPADNIDIILPTSNNLFPIDIKNNNYKDKIYYGFKYPHYIQYVKKYYNIEEHANIFIQYIKIYVYSDYMFKEYKNVISKKIFDSLSFDERNIILKYIVMYMNAKQPNEFQDHILTYKINPINIPIYYAMIFKPIDEALDDFYKNGGVLTQDELNKVDFNLIK